MTDGPAEDGPDRRTPARSEAERRRRRARVFGDVLPEGTRDDRGDEGSDPERAPQDTDEWLRRQVPPHHST